MLNKKNSLQNPQLQASHLVSLCHDAHLEMFPKMKHGQFPIDHPDDVAKRIIIISTHEQ